MIGWGEPWGSRIGAGVRGIVKGGEELDRYFRKEADREVRGGRGGGGSWRAGVQGSVWRGEMLD